MNTKRTAKAALATFGLSVMLPTAAFAATDIQGHWAGSVLAKWESQALISGYEDGTIRPDNQISRAEFVALVNRVAGYQDAGNSVKFKDVNSGDWYASQVAIAVNQGYIGGFEDNTFRPNDSVTRAQAASVLARIKKLPADEARANQFTDAASIPAWAKGVVGAVANAGYMVGNEANAFQAEKALTRAEAVASLDRVFGVKELKAQTLTLSATEGVISKIASKTITATSSVEGAVISAASSDEKVATVSVKENKVTIKGVDKGTATITVTAKADGYKDATATYKIDVTAAAGGGGGGGSSSSGGGSGSTIVIGKVDVDVAPGVTLTPAQQTAAQNLEVEYSVPVDKSSTATMTIAGLKDAYDVGLDLEAATLAANTRFTVSTATENYDISLNSALSVTPKGNVVEIKASDLKGKISDPAVQAKVDSLGDRKLITGTLSGDQITWDAEADIHGWSDIMSNINLTLGQQPQP